MSRTSPRRSRGGARRAFTLIEILVVIVVIAILASLVAPNVLQHIGTANDTAAKAQIAAFVNGLDAYRLHMGAYPTTEDGLSALVSPPQDDRASRWRGPYMRKNEIPLDPWSNPYVYVSPGEVNPNGFDLYSLGADGQPGGEGENADIVSW
jgi:general secretion pathway protein G